MLLRRPRRGPAMARPIDAALRARLIAAATDCFAARGFADVTVAEVGESAGVTKGGVYFHFRSKEALFYALVDHWRLALRSRLPDDGAELPGVELLERTAAAWLR